MTVVCGDLAEQVIISREKEAAAELEKATLPPPVSPGAESAADSASTMSVGVTTPLTPESVITKPAGAEDTFPFPPVAAKEMSIESGEARS